MNKAYTVIDNKVIEHTHKKIIGRHHTSNIEDFITYHDGHHYEYVNFKKYLETVTNNVLDEDIHVQVGPYGVKVLWEGSAHIISYNQDDLHYVQSEDDSYLEHTLIELVHRYNTDGWQDVVTEEEIESLVKLYFKGEGYITKYKLISWLDLMMNKVREEDFVNELITGLDYLIGVNLKRENTLDGYNINYNGQDIYKVTTQSIKGSRYVYFSDLFNVLSELGALDSDLIDMEDDVEEQAGVTLVKAVVTVQQGERAIDTLRGLNWEDGYQQYRHRVITAVQELTKEGEVSQITLGFVKGSQHIRMDFRDMGTERRVMLVNTLEELGHYDEQDLEAYVINGKEIHQIKMQINSAINDVI